MQPQDSAMLISNIKPVGKASLICTFELTIPKWGNFAIREMCYFQKGNQKWIGFPSRQYEKEGVKKYFPLNHFNSRETQDAFQKKVIEVLEPQIAHMTAPQPTLFDQNKDPNEGIPF